MKVDFKLNVAKQELYEILIASLKAEIKLYTDKDIEPYSGYKYDKILPSYSKSDRDVQALIVALEENELYAMQFNTKIDTTNLKILIKEVDDQIHVFYEETYDSEIKKLNFNHKVITFVTTFFNKRKVKKRFNAIEHYILTSRS
jgi:hypothetical protein